MSHSNLRDYLEVVGLFAIVTSLIFVAVEVRQSNQIGRLEAMQSIADE